MPPSLFISSLQSQFGEVSIVFFNTTSGPTVKRIFLSSENTSGSILAFRSFPEIHDGSTESIRILAGEIRKLFSGGIPEFNIRILDFSVCSGFQRKVLMEERKIPRGDVRSYGWLALRIGESGAARAVGNALATNPFPLIIPCHRAIRSDGTIGGFQGGTAMKRDLLEMEGITFNHSGRVQT